MSQDRRDTIDEPRLLGLRRDVQALARRLTSVEGQLDRHPLLFGRYLMAPFLAADPNTVAPGTEWSVLSPGLYDMPADVGAVGVDGRFTVAMPGVYEIRGCVFIDPDAIHQQLLIKRKQNGLIGRLVGSTAVATRTNNQALPGWFSWIRVAAAGDVLSIVTERADAAGTTSPHLSSGQESSWIEFIYRSHV